MFKVYIAKQVFEGVFKKPLVLGLTFLQLPLLKKTFNLIDGNLAFGVAWHNKKILIFVQSLDIETSDMIALDRFINQSFYFLFALII